MKDSIQPPAPRPHLGLTEGAWGPWGAWGAGDGGTERCGRSRWQGEGRGEGTLDGNAYIGGICGAGGGGA